VAAAQDTVDQGQQLKKRTCFGPSVVPAFDAAFVFAQLASDSSAGDGIADAARIPALALRSPARFTLVFQVSSMFGHETFYPRFGFAPASRWNLTGDYGSHDAFQFLPLTAAANEIHGGHIRYAPEFAEIFAT
jgi:hypothetical protein